MKKIFKHYNEKTFQNLPPNVLILPHFDLSLSDLLLDFDQLPPVFVEIIAKDEVVLNETIVIIEAEDQLDEEPCHNPQECATCQRFSDYYQRIIEHRSISKEEKETFELYKNFGN